ncbi:methyltransferase [Micromonospora sp. ATCC 39149]|uniref:Long-chain fatty acid--CoA ligase n=1 Tax=Micromonospora carbonacea TaxID=47853 RepID=A0A7D6GNZ0_9ACTN|nr:fatty acid--CoA ligase family protein [Micromonospora sp. ATCC 39149]EEP75247.1 methyltransferase [Micromonospora sp. ATCC 39149]QLK00969.1 long-chain fatty acid--CoA ligase [Micromonospora carbonacea]
MPTDWHPAAAPQADHDAVAALRERLTAHADERPDAPAVRWHTAAGWSETTWRELAATARRVAARATAELPAGRAVVVATVNTGGHAAVLLGLLAAGFDVVMVEHDSSYLADPLSAVYAARPGAVVAAVDGPRPAATGELRWLAVEDLVAGAPQAEWPNRAPGSPTVLQLTSGSTGEPRAAAVPLGSALRGGALYRDLFDLDERDTILAAVPLAHSFGFVGALCAAVLSGGTLALLARFTGRGLVEGLDAGVTALLATPFVYGLVPDLLYGRRRPDRLRVALCSGGPLTMAAAAAAAGRLGCPVRQIYGSTETGLIACQFGRPQPWPAEGVGGFVPGVQWRVEPVRDSDAGRLLVRTSTMFTGYVGRGRAEALRPDGYYDTGDLVDVNGAGDVTIVGRKATFINVGGRKVNPRRLERLIGELPGVRAVHVCGLPDARGNEEIHAVVELAPGTDPAAVVAGCRQRLTAYEVPHHVHAVDRLPRTALGKVAAPALRDLIADRSAGAPGGTTATRRGTRI